MLFAVIFTDKPGQGQLRAEHLQAHIAWVLAHEASVLLAGSLRIEPGDVPKGGLWIVEAASKAKVLELMKSDPFYTCGLRQHIEVSLLEQIPRKEGAGVRPSLNEQVHHQSVPMI